MRERQRNKCPNMKKSCREIRLDEEIILCVVEMFSTIMVELF